MNESAINKKKSSQQKKYGFFDNYEYSALGNDQKSPFERQ